MASHPPANSETAPKLAFSPGDHVLVKDETPPHHHRTPWYIKGRNGVVIEFVGMHVNSETRAYGGTGLPKLPIYVVEFDQTVLWSDYAGSPSDKLWIDVNEHWLERAE